MVEWWGKYFNNDSIEKVKILLQQFGKDDPTLHERLLERAALCRLSFASLKLNTEEAKAFGICSEAVISQTCYGMKEGHPKSAKWAFWVGYLIKKELKFNGKPPSSDFLSKLISILLTRKVTQEEARTKFSQLKSDAEDHAIKAARVFLRNNLFADLDDTEYETALNNYMGRFSETAQVGSFIVNGKIPKEWQDAIVKIRRSILMHIGAYGLLAGQEPFVKFDTATKIIHGVPIGGFVSDRPIPKGTIHLEKANEIDFPQPVLQQTINPVESSLNIKKDKEGGTMSLNFPVEAVTKGEPYAAAIIAVPVWWPTWQEYMSYAFKLRT